MSKDLLFILFWCCCCFCFPFFKKSQLASLPVCLWYWKERNISNLREKNKASILTLYCISILWLYLGYIVYIVISVYQYIYSEVSLLIMILCIVFNFNKIPNQHLVSLFCKSLPCCQPFIYTILCACCFMLYQGLNHCFALPKF